MLIIFSQSIKFLDLFRNSILLLLFSSLDISLILNVSTFRSKSVVRNSIICTDTTELEGIEREFATLCCGRFLPSDGKGYSYTNALQLLSLRTSHDRRH